MGDILRPLLQVVRLARPEQEPAFRAMVKVIEEERTADKADSLEAEVLRGVQDCEPDVEQGRLRIGRIVAAVNSQRPERYRITPQRVGKRLAAMGFTKDKLGKDRAVVWDGDLIGRLAVSYGLSADTSHMSHMS